MEKTGRSLVIGLLILALLAVCGFRALRIIKEGAMAYVYGYPLVLMDVTRQAMTDPGGRKIRLENHFVHAQFFPDHTFRQVVRPNNDTLYSTAWIDLSSGPLVLSVPDTAGRYYVMPFMDAWTNVFAMVGKRTTGTGPGDFLVVGPDWKETPPEGFKKILHSPTNMTWLIGRIQVNGRNDLENVFRLQERFTLTRLENWKDREANRSYTMKHPPSQSRKDPSAIVEKMSPEVFFSNLSRLMGEQPPAGADAPMLETLRTFSIIPGKPFDMENLGWIRRELLKKAVEIARGKLHDSAEADRSSENNWTVVRKGIGRYGTDYGVRALVAMVGLGALPPEEAAYPNAHKDGKGTPLTGKSNYRIHFGKGETPPVDAFWSLTMYDQLGFLVDNPIRRYAIGDRDRLRFNQDGSLDILIQHASPPREMESNWLPSPAGPFAVTMRLFMPKEAFLNGEWKLPPIERIPAR